MKFWFDAIGLLKGPITKPEITPAATLVFSKQTEFQNLTGEKEQCK